MPFSRSALQVVEAFAAGLGLPPRPARDGSFTFAFERLGQLTLTPAQDASRVLVSLARRPARLDAALMQRALARAGFDPTSGRVVHAGLAADDSLVYAASLDEAELDLPTIDGCLQQLAALHDAA
jgi:type III secretion system chaperone SycN